MQSSAVSTHTLLFHMERTGLSWKSVLTVAGSAGCHVVSDALALHYLEVCSVATPNHQINDS